MRDGKAGAANLEALVFQVIRHLAPEGSGRGGLQPALFIEEREEPDRFAREEVKDRFVILVFHFHVTKAFLFHFLDFKLEDVFVEEELELLVCKVDAKLLETVVGEVFESKDVEQA